MPLSWVEIDLAALRHNYHQARNRLGGDTHIVAIVKSDAYGHGMVPVAREAAGCGARFLGVSKFWEAEELRAAGIDLPVIVLLGVEQAEMEEAVREGFRPVVYGVEQVRLLSEAARKVGKPVPVHLKIDTGMGRLGVPMDRLDAFLDAVRDLVGVQWEGVLSHFAVADEADKDYSHLQLERFLRVLETLSRRGISVSYAHIGNSAGLLDLPAAHFQLVRPGIMLYGCEPSGELHHPAELEPVMSFKARILQVKEVPAGQSIGYGRTYIASRASRIATVPVGYDDGYSRLLSNRGQVLVGGCRAPVVGRVSMNMITVDVTNIAAAAEGSEVVLLGKQGDERITAEELARLSNTINYETCCLIGKHRHKVFLNATV